MEFKDGRLVLPHGVSYSVIVLPERTDIPLSVLKKLEKLVRDGATLLGPKPERDTSLADYPRCDEQVKDNRRDESGVLAMDKDARERSYGKGRVIADRNRVREILQQRGIGPDFAYSSPGKPADLDYIHRRTLDADIYFVSNTQMEEAEADCTFRVAQRLPQFWYPDTGEIEPCTDYARVPGGMKLKLRLPPAGSVFVVFSGTAPEAAPTPVAKEDGKPPAPFEIAGPWEVRFPPNLGAPPSRVFDKLVSWTDDSGRRHQVFLRHRDLPQGIRGAGIPAGRWPPSGTGLGQLRNVADVTLNGKPLGILWKPPYAYDVTGLVRSGKNELKIEIVNLWANRLVGDAKLPREKRVTRITQKVPIGGPHESGLLGPVQLRFLGKMR